ncbi:hypothetical protein [Salinilacihabitans rarus]|uniref:hypothetical protein n=1 Tax=Salinilacihabitans rarus TaxID=2961596 RepID=UPI0020C89A22|nr:hypothetical protein [Salinilacihabitans rarus]
MTYGDGLADLLLDDRQNAALSWAFVGVLGIATVERAVTEGDVRTAAFAAALVLVAVVPPLAFRDPTVTLPWDLLGVACSPVLWKTFVGVPFRTEVVPYVSVAVIALMVAVELHAFTAVRMDHTFAVVFVTLTTMAAAAVYNVLKWLVDVALGAGLLLDGRSQHALNAVVMVEFAYATGAGMLAGVAFTYYFRRRLPSPGRRPSDRPRSHPECADGHASLAERLRLSATVQRRLTRSMQGVLGAVLLYGLVTVTLPTIVNATVALGLTFVPAILERDLELPMDPGLVLWITAAVFLHSLGSAGLYGTVTHWDHLTHALSASVVAATGYAFFRAVDLHSVDVYIPRQFMFALILIFVLAAGVAWELLEFAIDQFAIVVGLPAVLAQHGLDDTILDLVFNAAGAVVVATWGAVYLTDLSEALSNRLEEWSA